MPRNSFELSIGNPFNHYVILIWPTADASGMLQRLGGLLLTSDKPEIGRQGLFCSSLSKGRLLERVGGCECNWQMNTCSQHDPPIGSMRMLPLQASIL